MDGATIDRALRGHPLTRDIYRGLSPADDAPACIRGLGFYVYNTDPSWMPGQHWVAQYNDGVRIRHFDSYGLPPFGPLAVAADSMCPGKVVYRKTRLQGDGETCGHFCLYYALHVADPVTYPMNAFDRTDLNGNDAKVTEMVEKFFWKYRRGWRKK